MFLLPFSAPSAFYFTQNNIKKKRKTTTTYQLTLGDLTNISVLFFPTCTIITPKYALFAITEPLVHESRVVFTAWLPLSPFGNSQRSSTHPGPIPGPFS